MSSSSKETQARSCFWVVCTTQVKECRRTTPRPSGGTALAAEQGLAEAQLNLGVMYDNGEGVPEDDTAAARWYRLAAEQGHPQAQLNLALQYITGQGAPVDHVRAYAWLDLGAAGGDPNAGNVRDSLAEAMTPQQITEAQALTRELADRISQH